ncbi:HET domain-containing protein [Fusarium falciforme]|uniref:HET domain-containing protein n=1 Tax=Fusarium falciforme TaxID=195108 RepID=UPI0022FFEB99|nr:HET domain-containing protein [Fusarium falciforme]WAO97154.1 HET domain-containing protein [Fusarium falciforme]
MAMIADVGVFAGAAYNLDAPCGAVSSDSTVGSSYSLLLRKWLWDCDQNHTKCKRPQRRGDFWPKRIIFVGDPNKLTLIENRLPGEDYLVLSHCWGRPTEEEKKRFCTTRQNYQDRLQGFSYDKLPRTFQDAVRVTRQLGKKYLWIDALCIIQGPDGDWKTEARTMEDIFACAYCTIAASSAGGWGDGFLRPDLDSQYIRMQGIASTPTCACDFGKDVDEGTLMKRAWVLQERVLSRRIIHFAATHTYWECGDGVRCEQFIKLEPPLGKQYFILDPNFPYRLSQSGYQRTVHFVRFLFRKYSTSGLTFESDRDVAIYSLVERMRHSLRSEVRYGIVRCFLSPLLLWKRTNEDKTAMINYGDRTVPSWSWMAYPGGIDFISDTQKRLMVPPSAYLDFTDDEDTLTVQVRRFKDCRIASRNARTAFAWTRKVGFSWFDLADRIGQDGKQYAIFASNVFAWTRKVGSLWFDVADRIEFKQCVVVGMGDDDGRKDPQKTYYFILVREKQDGEGYERLGVGKVEGRYVSRECDAAKLW